MTNEKQDKEENYFNKLSAIKGETEQKGPMKLTYMSWAVAWAELKKVYPKSNYEVHENANGMPYFADETGAFVKVTVRVIRDRPAMDSDNFIPEHTVLLPVMDYSNKSIQKDKLTVMDINKAIQRALVKAIAMHGLGLYVYKGEEFNEDTESVPKGTKTAPTGQSWTYNKPIPKQTEIPKADTSLNEQVPVPLVCNACGIDIKRNVADYSIKQFKTTLCFACQKKFAKKEPKQNTDEEEYEENPAEHGDD